MSSLHPKHYSKILALLIVGIAVWVRIKVYYQNRSLVLDESNLALNVVEKNFSAIWGVLDYEQVAPPLFLLIAKLFTATLGNYDFVLRMPVLLAGIASLILFYSIVTKLLETSVSRCYTLFMFGFSILIIRYSTEFKQYAFDMLSTLILLWLAVYIPDKITKRWVMWIGGLGTILIWLSMPIVFVLAALGVYLLYYAISTQKQLLPSVISMGTMWLISFYIYYDYNLSQNIGRQHLQDFHADFFINLLPTGSAEVKSSYQSLIRIFRAATDKTFIAIAWSMTTFLVGVFCIRKRNILVASFLTIPLMGCLLAAHMHMYSLIPRLLLFLIPLLLIGTGIGVDWLWSLSHRGFKVILLALMIITCINTKGYRYLYHKMEYEDIKSVAQYLKLNNRAQEPIIVHHDAVPAFRYYNLDSNRAWDMKNYHLLTWDQDLRAIVESRIHTIHFYILISHAFPMEKVNNYIAQILPIADLIDQYMSTEASVYYFQIKADQ